MDRKTTLVIVDFQYDFANPQGSMYVEGAEDAEKKILHYLDSHHSEIEEVVFTLDWHIPTHPSFQSEGGPWPRHCVQYTKGASVSEPLLTSAWYLGYDCYFFTKGETEEEYGAFSHINKKISSVEAFNHSGMCKYDINTNRKYVVCGLALDYCVKETAKNLKSAGLDVAVYLAGTMSISADDEAIDELEKHGVEII